MYPNRHSFSIEMEIESKNCNIPILIYPKGKYWNYGFGQFTEEISNGKFDALWKWYNSISVKIALIKLAFQEDQKQPPKVFCKKEVFLEIS